MKLGGNKKTKQAELLDALGAEALAPEEPTLPLSPVPAPLERVEPAVPKDGRGSIPAVTHERWESSSQYISPPSDTYLILSVHVAIKEQISLCVMREGGIKSMELKGDMNLQISDPALTHLRLVLAPSTIDFGSALQFKQHPNVAKFTPGQERVIALRDPTRALPVGQSLAVLKWRYAGSDESYSPLSGAFWSSSSLTHCP
jgi:hypothetical protein